MVAITHLFTALTLFAASAAAYDPKKDLENIDHHLSFPELEEVLPLSIPQSDLEEFRLNTFVHQGDAMFIPGHVVLVPPRPNLVGALWPYSPNPYDEWTIEYVVQIVGRHSTTGGMVLWFVSNVPEPPKETALHGGPDVFTGVAVVIDGKSDLPVHGNDKFVKLYINDGTHSGKEYKLSNAEDSCIIPHEDMSDKDVRIQVSYKYDGGENGNWFKVKVNGKDCVSSRSVVLPRNYYFGITAASGEHINVENDAGIINMATGFQLSDLKVFSALTSDAGSGRPEDLPLHDASEQIEKSHQDISKEIGKLEENLETLSELEDVDPTQDEYAEEMAEVKDEIRSLYAKLKDLEKESPEYYETVEKAGDSLELLLGSAQPLKDSHLREKLGSISGDLQEVRRVIQEYTEGAAASAGEADNARLEEIVKHLDDTKVSLQDLAAVKVAIGEITSRQKAQVDNLVQIAKTVETLAGDVRRIESVLRDVLRHQDDVHKSLSGISGHVQGISQLSSDFGSSVVGSYGAKSILFVILFTVMVSGFITSFMTSKMLRRHEKLL